MKREIASSVVVWVLGVGLCGGALSGCQGTSRTEDSRESTTIVVPRHDYTRETLVRVYNLHGIGLNDSTTEDIEAFMGTVRELVVTKKWHKTKSSIQIFGSLMTVRTTPTNHLLIENYLNEVRRVMKDTTMSMGVSLR